MNVLLTSLSVEQAAYFRQVAAKQLQHFLGKSSSQIQSQFSCASANRSSLVLLSVKGTVFCVSDVGQFKEFQDEILWLVSLEVSPSVVGLLIDRLIDSNLQINTKSLLVQPTCISFELFTGFQKFEFQNQTAKKTSFGHSSTLVVSVLLHTRRDACLYPV